jgi:hypothetical protein
MSWLGVRREWTGVSHLWSLTDTIPCLHRVNFIVEYALIKLMNTFARISGEKHVCPQLRGYCHLYWIPAKIHQASEGGAGYYWVKGVRQPISSHLIPLSSPIIILARKQWGTSMSDTLKQKATQKVPLITFRRILLPFIPNGAVSGMRKWC